MSINLQQKKFPKLYDFKGAYICELSEALNVSESLRLGNLNTLNFEYPVYQVDSFNNLTKDSLGNLIRNPKANFIENDIRCLFDERWYIIKIDEDTRDDSNKLFISCSCYDIGYTLQELMVEYLDLTPPINLAVNATNAIKSVLESAQQVRDNYVVSTSTNTVTLDANAHPVDDAYNGYKIKILSGTGAGQERTITDYNGTTKVATLSSTFSPQPIATSVYRIYNDIWKVGTIATALNTDLRAHYFDFTNALECLQQVRDKYLDANDNVGYLSYTSSFNYTTNRWENFVHLKQANAYGGVDFRYTKNLKSVTRRKESQELYTRIIPNGVDNLTVGSMPTANRIDSLVSYPEHIAGYNYIDNFQYFLAQGYSYKDCLDNFVKTYHFEDYRYTTASALYNDSRKMLNKMSNPKFTYLVSALDLSKLTGREYESFDIGDTIRVFDDEQKIDIYATISVIDRNQSEPQNATIEITNYVDRMSDILKRLVGRGDNYTDIYSQYGNAVTYIVADKLTSKNWRQADFVVQEFESASVVIQKVIDQLSSLGGGVLVLLSGQYGFTTTVALKDNVTLVGGGVSTRIYPKLADRGLAFRADGRKNIVIKDIFIDYTRQADGITRLYRFSDGIGIYSGCDNVLVDNIVQEYVNNNMFIAISSSNITIKNSIFQSINFNFNGSDGLDFKGCNNANVQNNIFLGNFNVGNNGVIAVADQVGVTSGSVTIRNNYMYIGFSGFFSSPIYVVTEESVTVNISNNTIYSINSSSGNAGINVGGKFIDVSNNIIVGNFNKGIMSVTRSTTSVSNILNNNITMNGTRTTASLDDSGIRVAGNSAGHGKGNIQGNSVKRGTLFASTTTAIAYGIKIDSGCVGVLCANNDLTNSGVISSFSDSGSGTIILGGNKL